MRSIMLVACLLTAAVSTRPTAAQTEGSEPAIPAARLIEILSREPELLAELKRAAARQMQEQGRAVSEATIPDDVVFQRIAQDAEFRALLTRQLESRGSLGSASPAQRVLPSSVPSLKSPQASEKPPEDQNQPATASRPNPYQALPSLQDLYRQVPRPGPVLKRFGADIFINGTGNLDNLPMDLPAGPDYVLGPGDGLDINLWGSVSQRLTRTVDREGRISLPEAGAVLVDGLTVAQAQESIQKALGAQFRDARVDVSLSRLRTVRVYVVGDVERPGAYDISSLSTPLNALYSAGGPTARGSLRTLRHYRGRQLVREVDLYELMLHGIRSDVERLQPGDTILVPPLGPQVVVAGMVRRPATYELKGETGLSNVLDLAGGVLVSATLRQIQVERIEAHQRRLMLEVTLPATVDKENSGQAWGDFHVQDGDRVTISPILPYSEKTVYLEGHVFRPGKYPFHEGMQFTDLVRGYPDLLPEPAEHAEVVRLVAPDHHPQVMEFKLSEVLGGEDPIELRPFDTLRIFGRYEIDAPKVFIYGEVQRPGEYPLAAGMTAGALVRLAGGFKRSAFTQVADIASHEVQNGEKIVTQRKPVEIAKVLAGDTTADAILKPGDVLTIRQLAGWREIGASVTVNGEVSFPGTYGLQEGEKLSTLLKQAGGFRAQAYPEGAVLERTQVRELEEKSRRDLIQRLETTGGNLKVAAGTKGENQAGTMQAALQQQQHALNALRAQPLTGRLVIKISPAIEQWQNTPADIELRAGDVLTIPKRPSFVLISGQVYNPSAITYSPGRKAEWYLRQAGGPTTFANKHDIYIIRANGSVLGQGSSGSRWWKGNVLSASLHPGDTIVVPEKIVTGSTLWNNLLTAAQMTTNLAIAAKVATSF